MAKLTAAVVLEAASLVPAAGRFGNKVFVSALYGALPDQIRKRYLLPDLKRWLVDANRDGKISLARADLVGAMDPGLVADSEIVVDFGFGSTSSFHFVTT